MRVIILFEIRLIIPGGNMSVFNGEYLLVIFYIANLYLNNMFFLDMTVCTEKKHPEETDVYPNDR